MANGSLKLTKIFNISILNQKFPENLHKIDYKFKYEIFKVEKAGKVSVPN